MPRSRLFLLVGSAMGVLAVITMEAGWVVSEVGRQPWIVYEYQTVEDAVTTNTGIWVMTVVVGVLYAALGATTIYVLHSMSRRFRAADGGDDAVPYGPREDAPERDEPMVPAP